MGKNVFRSSEIHYQKQKLLLKSHVPTVPETPAAVDNAAALEALEYTGPTAEQMKREAEEFKKQWDIEREEMMQNARSEAEQIVKDAEKEAEQQIQERTEEANTIKQKAEEALEKAIAEGKAETERMVNEGLAQKEKIHAEARQEGYEAGYNAGISKGQEEIARVIDRFHLILSKAIERRNEIIQESEAQLVSLVLGITKKVVKVISENQKDVVVRNIVEAVKQLQKKTDIVVRVNLADITIAAKHKNDILGMAESVKNITIAEDSSVDPGGCLIETDFGEIDARISSQLREIEDGILKMMPIKKHATHAS